MDTRAISDVDTIHDMFVLFMHSKQMAGIVRLVGETESLSVSLPWLSNVITQCSTIAG
jgi:hypothetical protein